MSASDCTLFIAHFTLHIGGRGMGRDGPHYNCSVVRVGRFPEPRSEAGLIGPEADCTLFIAHFTLHIGEGKWAETAHTTTVASSVSDDSPAPERSGSDWSGS